MMNPAELDKIKQSLLDQLDEVSTEIKEHSDTATLPTSEVESAIVNSDDALLKKIELALQRIEAGTYGKCTSCDAGIQLARLKAKPSVSLCTKCQEDKEKR
jgi:DnaK suppressor protein